MASICQKSHVENRLSDFAENIYKSRDFCDFGNFEPQNMVGCLVRVSRRDQRYLTAQFYLNSWPIYMTQAYFILKSSERELLGYFRTDIFQKKFYQ